MINKKLKRNAKKVDKFLINFINSQKKSLLVAPMKYGVISGGKKIRSTIIFDVGRLFKIKEKKLIHICAAVECIHSYSLIHDDLPCMDEDDLSRNKPSLHKAYDESTAVLTGDFLLTLSFGLLSQAPHIEDSTKLSLIQTLSRRSGAEGMIGGQMMDLYFENKQASLKALQAIHDKKTAALISASLEFAGIIAKVEAKTMNSIQQCGRHLGVLFQIVDDILDHTSTEEALGKPIHSDIKNNKSTYVSLLGLSKAKEMATHHFEQVMTYLSKIEGQDIIPLQNFCKLLLNRTF